MIPALRDVSLIILIVPMLLCLLIPLAILGGSVYLMGKGNQALRPKLQQAHRAMRGVEAKVDRVSHQVAKPFISLEMKWVQAQTFWRGLWRNRMKS
jgi:hypothetical protein